MKSIKEKSLEVFPEHCNYTTSSDNRRKRIGFVTGANYVLEQFENSLQEFSNYEDSLIISRIIEQLKK